MPLNFFSLPSEIRNRIYEELLVLEQPIMIEMDVDQSRIISRVLQDINSWGISKLFPAILLANKRIYREATSLLYSMNRFIEGTSYTFPCTTLASFLHHIGSQNAGSIRQICITFPTFDCSAKGVTLHESSARDLEIIREKCANLATLETSLGPTTAAELSLESFRNPRAASEALALMDTRFRAISSLKEIIVNVYNIPSSLNLAKKMRGCGWTVKVTEQEEPESDKSGSVGDFGYETYDSDYWDENIEEEEDLWRYRTRKYIYDSD